MQESCGFGIQLIYRFIWQRCKAFDKAAVNFKLGFNSNIVKANCRNVKNAERNISSTLLHMLNCVLEEQNLHPVTTDIEVHTTNGNSCSDIQSKQIRYIGIA
jgi:hypothetical protein